MIADTAFVIDVMRKNPDAVRKARKLEETGTTISVGSPTVFELFAGVALSGKPDEEKARITRILASLPQMVLDSPSAIAGGLILGEKMKAGLTVDPEDAMIAGIAKIASEKVLTRNLKHFSGIEGVSVENY